ncbi:unnamed protein product, partial [Rotaria sp. Silwood2]
MIKNVLRIITKTKNLSKLSLYLNENININYLRVSTGGARLKMLDNLTNYQTNPRFDEIRQNQLITTGPLN